MENENNPAEKGEKKIRFGLGQVLGIIAVVMIVTALISGWWIKHYMYASPFKPTQLNAREEKVLQTKLAMLDKAGQTDSTMAGKNQEKRPGEDKNYQGSTLKPERYTEEGADREIKFSQKELNALIANEPEVAQKVAIDLSDDLVSIKLVVPMDEGIFILGGKTLRINLGTSLSYDNGKPVVALKGVSLGGVPLPNAWLGNLKNKNLVDEFGSEEGFWKLFADGVQNLKVKDGHLQITLKE